MSIEFDIKRDDLSDYFKAQFKNIDSDEAYIPAVLATEDVMFDWLKIAGGAGENSADGAPVDTGLLRSSGSVGVQGDFLAASDNEVKGGEKPKVVREFDENKKGEILGIIGFNTEYAAFVHEMFAPAGPIQALIEGRGKFVEATARENMKKWIRHIASEVRKGLEKE